MDHKLAQTVLESIDKHCKEGNPEVMPNPMYAHHTGIFCKDCGEEAEVLIAPIVTGKRSIDGIRVYVTCRDCGITLDAESIDEEVFFDSFDLKNEEQKDTEDAEKKACECTKKTCKCKDAKKAKETHQSIQVDTLADLFHVLDQKLDDEKHEDPEEDTEGEDDEDAEDTIMGAIMRAAENAGATVRVISFKSRK